MTPVGWIALLRGINVGGHNMIPMPALRQLFEDTGCSAVSSYIQSGNVLFLRSDGADRDALARELEGALRQRFGVRSAVVLRTFGELSAVAAEHPFGTDTTHSFVAFLPAPPAAEGVRSLGGAEHAPDRFVLAGRDVYLYLPNGVRGARLSGPVLERHLGMAATNRNWKTVTRLAELAQAAQG